MNSVCWKCKATFEVNAESVGTCPRCWKAADPQKEVASSTDRANPCISPEQFTDFKQEDMDDRVLQMVKDRLNPEIPLSEVGMPAFGVPPTLQQMTELVQKAIYAATQHLQNEPIEEVKDQLASICVQVLMQYAPVGADTAAIAQLVKKCIEDSFPVKVDLIPTLAGSNTVSSP